MEKGEWRNTSTGFAVDGLAQGLNLVASMGGIVFFFFFFFFSSSSLCFFPLLSRFFQRKRSWTIIRYGAHTVQCVSAYRT